MRCCIGSDSQAGDGSTAIPSLAVYMSYFAFLFLLPRWWRQAECTRERRMSLWWVAVCVFWAWLLHFFWWFPQPTGMMAAGVIATATQLASPWMPPSRRRALTEQMERGASRCIRRCIAMFGLGGIELVLLVIVIAVVAGVSGKRPAMALRHCRPGDCRAGTVGDCLCSRGACDGSCRIPPRCSHVVAAERRDVGELAGRCVSCE